MEDLFIPDMRFYGNQYCTYPPFKLGHYLEEFFFDYCVDYEKTRDKNGRLYIPALWTAMQIEGWFPEKKQELQQILDDFIMKHPNDAGYFTVVQHDDGVLFDLPPNTIVYGACSGNVKIPLIYQDRNQTLESQPKLTYQEKPILCSFVGTITHPIRQLCYDVLHTNPSYEFYMKHNWTNNVDNPSQSLFIEKTRQSKFALAPRGYGRSSFRFFEIFQLGTIPIYIWDDVEWLPYTELLDYSKFCISIHENQIDELDTILSKIDETKYQEMWKEYEKIKHMFELDFMVKYILE